MAVPGLTPKSPVMIVAPVLVTVEAPRTAKVCAEPNGGADCARPRLPRHNMHIAKRSFFISQLVFSVIVADSAGRGELRGGV
jgi:hypothetical protein